MECILPQTLQHSLVPPTPVRPRNLMSPPPPSNTGCSIRPPRDSSLQTPPLPPLRNRRFGSARRRKRNTGCCLKRFRRLRTSSAISLARSLCSSAYSLGSPPTSSSLGRLACRHFACNASRLRDGRIAGSLQPSIPQRDSSGSRARHWRVPENVGCAEQRNYNDGNADN